MKYYKDWSELIGGCLIILILILICSFVSALVLMLLWNWLAPIFWNEAPVLGYWEAYGINIFLGLLGGFFKSTVRK